MKNLTWKLAVIKYQREVPIAFNNRGLALLGKTIYVPATRIISMPNQPKVQMELKKAAN